MQCLPAGGFAWLRHIDKDSMQIITAFFMFATLDYNNFIKIVTNKTLRVQSSRLESTDTKTMNKWTNVWVFFWWVNETVKSDATFPLVTWLFVFAFVLEIDLQNTLLDTERERERYIFFYKLLLLYRTTFCHIAK